MSQKKRPVYGHRRPKRSPLPALMILCLALVGSLMISVVWQVLDTGVYDPTAFAKEPSSQGSSSENSGSSASSSSSSDPESPSSDPESSQGTPQPSGAGGLVPEGEWLPSSYFDDALFVGDSITEGIKLYDVMSNATVLSNTGINLDSIFTKRCIDGADGGSMTIIEASAQQDPGKIYLLMGVNSLSSDEETFIASYGKLVDTLREQHPNAVFYVQSVLPVTAAYEKRADAVTDNARIDTYNAAILKMCQEKGVYYLNIAEAFKDETGALPNEASPKDGIHFGRSWYMTWFDYLRNHGAGPQA